MMMAAMMILVSCVYGSDDVVAGGNSNDPAGCVPVGRAGGLRTGRVDPR